MNKNKLFITIIIPLLSMHLYCRNITIKGTVTDSETGEAIELANVWIKGTIIGTATDEKGFFELDCPENSKIINVSVVGYKLYGDSIDKSRSLFFNIKLTPNHQLLNEITIKPTGNPAIKIINDFDKNRKKNNPDSKYGFSLYSNENTEFFLSNVNIVSAQTKMYKELEKGMLPVNDTLKVISAYINKTLSKKSFLKDSIATKILDKKENALNILPPKQWRILFDYYMPPNVNFYDNTVELLGKKFISPLASYGKIYYKYWLVDSTKIDGRKTYKIDYTPKNKKMLIFKGSMWIDSTMHALKKIEATATNTSNINFVNKLAFVQCFDTLANNKQFFYSKKEYTIGVEINFTTNKENSLGGAILHDKESFSKKQNEANEKLTSDTTGDNTNQTSVTFNKSWENIDNMNTTFSQRLAKNIVNLAINGYWNAGKIDIGPIINMFNFNRLEGYRYVAAARTSEKLFKNFTTGGYLGYGTYDKKTKGGFNIQWRFGKRKYNQLAFFYDNRSIRYGYEDIKFYDENRVYWIDNILSTPYTISPIPHLTQTEKFNIRYMYEKKGLRLQINAQSSHMFGNKFTTFTQNGNNLSNISIKSISGNLRLSWKESSFDNFFNRYYVSTHYPIITAKGEFGTFNAGKYKNKKFGKATIVIRHYTPLALGRISYTIEGTYVMGDVPFPLLYIPRGTVGVFHAASSFALMEQMEFMADKYAAIYLKYRSNGFFLNKIPYINKLNLRENAMFNIGYGSLNDNNNKILGIPQNINGLKTPYMEAGVGISNIFRIITVESFWRLSKRDYPGTENWGMKFRFDLDF